MNHSIDTRTLTLTSIRSNPTNNFQHARYKIRPFVKSIPSKNGSKPNHETTKTNRHEPVKFDFHPQSGRQSNIRIFRFDSVDLRCTCTRFHYGNNAMHPTQIFTAERIENFPLGGASADFTASRVKFAPRFSDLLRDLRGMIYRQRSDGRLDTF